MMRAAFVIIVGGNVVTERFAPLLEQLSVSDKAGTVSDAASITLDESSGQIAMPSVGDLMAINLGWEEGGVAQVFEGDGRHGPIGGLE
jgi:phage protein D